MPPPQTVPSRRARKLSRRDCYRVSRQPPRRASQASIPIGCLDEETRRRICSLIAGVICADDRMTPEERTFLRGVMIRLQIEPDTALMPIYAAEAPAEIRKLPRSLLHTTLDLAIFAAVADGEVVAAERRLVDAIAIELGVSRCDVDRRLERALDRTHAAISQRDAAGRRWVSNCDNRDGWGRG